MLAEWFLGALNDLRENAGDRSSLANRQAVLHMVIGETKSGFRGLAKLVSRTLDGGKRIMSGMTGRAFAEGGSGQALVLVTIVLRRFGSGRLVGRWRRLLVASNARHGRASAPVRNWRKALRPLKVEGLHERRRIRTVASGLEPS